MNSELQASEAKSGGTSKHRTRAIAVAGAVLAASLLWLAAQVFGIELQFEAQPGQPIVVGLPSVLGFSLGAALLGWAFLTLLERVTDKARIIWTGLASAALLGSFVPLLTVVDATAGAKSMLALMHVAVGGVLIPTFWKSASKR